MNLDFLYFLFNPTEGDPDVWANDLTILAMVTIVVVIITTLIPFFKRYKRNTEVAKHRKFLGLTFLLGFVIHLIFCALLYENLMMEGGIRRFLEIIFPGLLLVLLVLIIVYPLYMILRIPTFKLRRFFVKEAVTFGLLSEEKK